VSMSLFTGRVFHGRRDGNLIIVRPEGLPRGFGLPIALSVESARILRDDLDSLLEEVTADRDTPAVLRFAGGDGGEAVGRA
jgi:hypothetical protein